MLVLIQHEYTWPGLQTFASDYCKSCTTCGHAKTPCHHPYGTLKQLPIPGKPWNSISMDFIEQLLPSSGFTSILVMGLGNALCDHGSVTSRFVSQSVTKP